MFSRFQLLAVIAIAAFVMLAVGGMGSAWASGLLQLPGGIGGAVLRGTHERGMGGGMMGGGMMDGAMMGGGMMDGAMIGHGMRGGAMMGSGMMGGHPGSGHMGGNHRAMHQAMHGGGDMPEECAEHMDDPAMMDHGLQRLHGGMDPDECRARMAEHGLSAEGQDECLAMMLHLSSASKEDGAQQPQ